MRMKTGSIPPEGFGVDTPEEELKARVGQRFFRRWDYTKILGKIDLCVGIPTRHAGGGNADEFVSLLWAEAKRGRADLREALVQLVLTIGRARTFDRHLPPPLLAAFDCEQIAFVAYSRVQAVFMQNDFNWRVAPSDHASKEFLQLDGLIGESLERESAIFSFAGDERALREFIWRNLGHYAGGVARVEIDKNNFTWIYQKWCDSVLPTINADWEAAGQRGIIAGDFFLADILSEENKTLKDKLFVLLQDNRYILNRRVNASGFLSREEATFTDRQQRHTQFWNRYTRPPLQEYWDYLVSRRDLLVPPDIRERKGSFFTPRRWVELSQHYLAEYLGENWQEEYTVWDPAAGTGNLLNGLSNKYNIWASTIDQQDVDVMHDLAANGAELLDAHIFRFDFLNDDFGQLPMELRAIVESPSKRKKLVIYMNPPYAEVGNMAALQGTRANKKAVEQSGMNSRYAKELRQARRELYAQFLARIWGEIPGCIIGEFSKLKTLQGAHFSDFRGFFRAKLEKLFLVPADTFGNVKGQFPIGFKIWNTGCESEFREMTADVYDAQGHPLPCKTVRRPPQSGYINEWSKTFRDTALAPGVIGKFPLSGSDFQHQRQVQIVPVSMPYCAACGQFYISARNLLVAAIYFSARHCISGTWLNDRDQFLWPQDSWKDDAEFQHDCLAYALMDNQIRAQYGANHWIPYTEHEVDAKEKFQSHFMTDFLSGKLGREKGETGDLFAESIDLIPKEPVVFSPEARAVMEAGRTLWRYYHAQPNANPNAALYDIRLHFQGCKPNGHMNPKSDDPRYMELISTLRERLKALARKIEPRVYEHGFLLG